MLYTESEVAAHALTSSTVTMIAVGIDWTSGRQALTYAALDRDLRVLSLAEAELDDLIEYLAGHASSHVAVNSPSHVNTGVIRKRLESQRGAAHAIRGADIREAEHELRERSIPIGGTPRTEALSPGWMQLGFELYRRLAALAFKPFPLRDAERQWLETHPHSGFCTLLGRPPLARPTVEGRLQRALVLFERGVRIHDPMAFLEEITRHRLLHGLLPMELVPAQEQLDALLAAYTAWLSIVRPGDVTQVGNRHEGFVTLPVSQLQDKY